LLKGMRASKSQDCGPKEPGEIKCPLSIVHWALVVFLQFDLLGATPICSTWPSFLLVRAVPMTYSLLAVIFVLNLSTRRRQQKVREKLSRTNPVIGCLSRHLSKFSNILNAEIRSWRRRFDPPPWLETDMILTLSRSILQALALLVPVQTKTDLKRIACYRLVFNWGETTCMCISNISGE